MSAERTVKVSELSNFHRSSQCFFKGSVGGPDCKHAEPRCFAVSRLLQGPAPSPEKAFQILARHGGVKKLNHRLATLDRLRRNAGTIDPDLIKLCHALSTGESGKFPAGLEQSVNPDGCDAAWTEMMPSFQRGCQPGLRFGNAQRAARLLIFPLRFCTAKLIGG